MTLANSVFAKASVAFVALATAFVLAAPAQAQMSESEMQTEIDRLTALIESLTASLGGGSTVGGGSMSSSSACPYTWTRSLSSGDTGMDVMKLQQFLNSNPLTRVAAAGAGSPGSETEYYGPATGAAVAKFQEANRAAILSPLGLVNSTTFFGPSTMAEANRQCASAPVVTPTPTPTPGDDANDDDDNGELRGGEADVTIEDVDEDEDELQEGEEDVPVMVVSIEVEDGDVRLERADIALEQTAGTGAEDEPWNAFEEISIWVDGDKVASADVTDEDDWDDNYDGGSSFTDGYTFRMTNIDAIFREDGDYEIVFALTVASNVLDDGEADTWDMALDDNGLRFMDGEGLDIQVGEADDEIEFEIVDESSEDSLDLESSDNDPEATTLEVDDEDETEHMVFAFVLNAEDGENDIELNDITLDIVVAGDDTDFDTVGELVDDFYIMIDGEQFDADTDAWPTNTETAFFDIDGDFTIEGEEEVEVEVYAIFNDVDAGFATATIQVSVDTTDIDAEGAEDVTVGGNDRNGKTHTLRQNGIVFADEPSDGTGSTDSTQVVGETTDDNYGTMFLEFTIEVFGDDLWVPIEAATEGVADSSSGLTYQILKSGVATSTNIVEVVDWDIEGADEDNGYYELEEGQTYTVVVNVESMNPEVTGLYSFRVNSIGFNATEDTAPDTSAVPAEASEYVSDAVSVQS